MDKVPVYPLRGSPKESIYEEIGKQFTNQFGSPPEYFVRVPGRVNLIGEHIDYCGFSVLPMAIEQDIVLAIKSNDSNMMRLVNLDKRYPSFTLTTYDRYFRIKPPSWYEYFFCGHRGIVLPRSLSKQFMYVVVKGTIPPSAGLSSSSALVCAGALAASHANGLSFTKLEMAEECAMAEKHIGTEGGGMDQAIAFLAEPGCAKLISFNPLQCENVRLPKGVVFVIANSRVENNKAASSQFNVRVAECKLAAKVLAKFVPSLNWKSVERLYDIYTALGSFEKAIDLVTTHLTQPSYSKKEIYSILELREGNVFDNKEFSNILSKNTQDLQDFKLAQRAKHVFEEADRVLKFKEICESWNENAKEIPVMLGKLMNESHKSLKDLYECSNAMLDELIEISLAGDALGSRLTGAGWGGCCVSLVREQKLDHFLKFVRKYYYSRKFPKMREEELQMAIFVARPGEGAAVYTVKEQKKI